MNNQINISVDEAGTCNVEVSGKPGVREIQNFFQAIKSEETTAISIAMPASSAYDFMLIQVLAAFKNEGKTITIQWTDHEPGPHLFTSIKSLIQN